jgi:hypothetical protein
MDPSSDAPMLTRSRRKSIVENNHSNFGTPKSIVSKRKAAEFKEVETVAEPSFPSVAPTLLSHNDNINMKNTNGNKEEDPSISFFFRPHTISLLLAMLFYFLYVAYFETVQDIDVLSNTKT